MDRRWILNRVYVNRSGYDSGGAYWGVGEPLYWYSCPTGEHSGTMRASSRDDAKRQLRKVNGEYIRFYR